MKGTIRKRGEGRWQVQVGLGRDASGNYRRKAKTVHGSKRDADAALRQLIDEVESGHHRPESAGLTVPQLVLERIAKHEADWSPRTVMDARDRVRLYLSDPELPTVPKLTARDIEAFYARLRSRGLAPATVRRAHADLNAALNQAVKWDLIAVNPAKKVDTPKVPKREIQIPTDEQVRDLIATAPDDMATWLRVAAHTGHRGQALAGLRWSDVDFDKSTVLFARAVVRGEDGLVVKSTKAERMDRVTLGAGVAGALRQHRTRMAERALSAGVTLADDAYVWSPDPDGLRPWDPAKVSAWFTRHRRSRGLPDGMSLHTLRHYAITRMVSEGMPLSIVADRVGAGVQVIESVYRHHLPGQDQAAADLMDRLLGT